jgi:hypothetical protein
VTHCHGLTLKIRVLWYVRKRFAKHHQRVFCPSLKARRLIYSKNSYYESALKNRLLCSFLCKERLNTFVGTKDSMLSWHWTFILCSIKHPTRCTINLIFIALSRRHRSTCFGHCCSHHQEPPPTAFAASGYRMIAGLDVFQAVVCLLVRERVWI